MCGLFIFFRFVTTIIFLCKGCGVEGSRLTQKNVLSAKFSHLTLLSSSDLEYEKKKKKEAKVSSYAKLSTLINENIKGFAIAPAY